MENFKMIFESENIYYIKLNRELINDYLEMVNNYEVQKFISHNIKKYTYEEELKWVNDKLENKDIIYSMIEKNTGKFIGNIEIMDINNGIGEIGISIIPNMQNKHYGTESMKKIIEYGFNDLGLEELELNVFNDNYKAIKCYMNVGFIEDGIGKTKDDIHMIYKRQ